MVSPDPILFEIDDVTTDRWRETRQYIYGIKKNVPDFKCTLWVIPAFCLPCFYDDIRGWDWIQFGLHGNTHWRRLDGKVEETGGECDQWSYQEAKAIIKKYNALLGDRKKFPGFNFGFKAPWYYTQVPIMRALTELDFFIASHKIYTIGKQRGMKVYDYNKYSGSMRYHIQDNQFAGDGIGQSYKDILKKFGIWHPFDFVSNHVDVIV